MNSKIFVAAIAASILIYSMSSCHKHKHDHDNDDQDKPVITVLEPKENDTIPMSSNQIHVEFKVTDNSSIHDVAFKITNSAGQVLFNKSKHADNKTYIFHEHYKPTNITQVTPLKLTIDASDHNSNADTKVVNFFVKP